ncbi:MAG: flavodoxin family protein [Deltaproteobacteria bacterium]|nr:MAG: flavodoxin family protein [Deltaproteobacteria bacterium]
MKSLLVYSSRSGNTQKLAKAVYNELKGEKRLVPITELPLDNYDYDLVALGFPIMAGRVEPRAARFLAGFEQKTRLVLFMTHGSRKDSRLVQDVMAQATALVKNAEIVGRYSCQGEVEQKVLGKLAKSSHPFPWLKDAGDAKGHPDCADIKALVRLITSFVV